MSRPDDLTDDEVEARLAAQPAEMWAELFATVHALTPDDVAPHWGGGQQTGTRVRDGVEYPVYHVRYPVYTERADRMLTLWRELGVVFPFDWPSWLKTHRYPEGVGLADAPVAHAARLATALVRADRFNEGAIARYLQDGTTHAINERLRHWWERRV